jgi:two-component system, NarL family, sensor histidine kinase UhpB
VAIARELPLFWKVFLINGAVLAAALVALVLTPLSVSAEFVVSEAVVLAIGLTVMLLTNAALLRASLAPVDRVLREMATVDLLDPGARLEPPHSQPGAQLVAGFNAMLDRLEAERRTSNAKVLAAQEAERDRVARELHDQVGQDLTVVLLSLKQLEQRVPAELAGELAAVREGARTSLDDVRRVARELRPGTLDDLGLVSAVAALTNDFAGDGTASVRRVVSPGLPELSRESELVVYRVAQEALTNAHRHARASEVEVSLTRLGDRVVLEVADDGIGPGDLVPGAGVRGMRERALLVGGRVTITTSPRRGTLVRLEVPVEPPR